MKIWTDNPAGPDTDIIPVQNGVNLGSAENPFGTVFATNINIDGVVDNYALSVYAAGTAYTLTATSAAVDFGTTDPVLTIDTAGTYLLFTRVNYEYVGATFAANRDVTTKLRRTNNTPADVSNSSSVIGTNIVTTVNGVLEVLTLNPVLYTTTNVNDAITIYADVSVLPSAGSLQITEASIVAIRLY